MISLVLDKPNHAHNDLLFTFPDGSYRSDSYFFGFADRNIRYVLRKLLSQWIVLLETAKTDDFVYLLFSLEDQGSGWMRCLVGEGEILFQVTISTVEGYKINPLNFSEVVTWPEFNVIVGDNVKMHVVNLNDFIDSIRKNIELYED